MRKHLARYGRVTFSSLRIRNYRLYFIGQAISLCGTWMQMIGLALLVFRLTGSITTLGIVSGLQFLPVLLLAPYGGVLADRFSKRRLLFATQGAAGVLALLLGLAVATGVIQLWMLYVLAVSLGLVNALDNPTRQSFIHELVGPKQLGNAVALNSTEVNLTRVIGPALAGVLIAVVGLAPCFLINAASYVAVLVCLLLMRGSELQRAVPVKAAKGQLREGFAYVMRTPIIRDVLVMMALVGTLTYEFAVTLPAVNRFTFGGGPLGYAALTCAMGLGAVLGGLATAGRLRPTVRELALASFGFGVTTALVAISPTLTVAVLGMLFVGVFSIRFTALCNTILQLESEPRMRSRVMALWSVAFLGSTVVGGPLIGLIGDHFTPRWALGVGAIAAVAAGIVGLIAVRAHAAAVAQVPAEES
jgi:MFS family permease